MSDRRLGWARWVALAGAVAAIVVFLLAQRQTTRVSYARSPAGPGITEGSAGELSGARVPSVERMTAMVAAEPVVRLPGAVARWDQTRVRAAIGADAVRILVAPPGLSEADQDRVRDVGNATVRVIGTEVSGGVYRVAGSTAADWRSPFATGDVTQALVTLIAGLGDRPKPAETDALQRREPTAAEITRAAATARRITAPAAFPGASVLVVELPRQPYGVPMPRFGPALARLHPGTPVLVMYGSWIEYDGPDAAAFADVASASFYGQFAERLGRYDHPQRVVLNAYLDRVADLRYAGVFTRPLPYRPADPLRVALPVLPWLFTGCVLVFLALSVRAARQPTRLRDAGTPARLAALAALAVEISLLTDRRGDAALTRGLQHLGAARAAIDEDLPDEHVRGLLDEAESELDTCARRLPFRGYRPSEYPA